MYAPSYNKSGNHAEIIRFIRAHEFATLVTHDGRVPLASHLLFMVEKEDPLTLTGHMARANRQWQTFGQQESMVIFQGPHAYISPSDYRDADPIPTWNYVAVHAYGHIDVIENPDDMTRLMHRLVRHHDPGFYEKTFTSVPDDFISEKLKRVVAFTIRVTRVEERFKLSQDKSDQDRASIVTGLGRSGAGGQAVAEEMSRFGKEKGKTNHDNEAGK